MATYVRRLHLVAANDVAAEMRNRLHSEFTALSVGSIKDQLGIARVARASAPTVQIGWGLSGIFTQAQWDRLKSFKADNPDLNGAKLAFQGSADLYDSFWDWCLTLTPALVPLQEEGP